MPVGQYIRKPRGSYKRFCPKGHDTSIVGRRPTSYCCSQCNRESVRRIYKMRTDTVRLHNNRKNAEYGWKRYGITNPDGRKFTLIDYDRLYQIQSGKCLGCTRHSTSLKRVLDVDHNHADGNVRGLLCYDCNRLLGLAKDDIETLKRLIRYLEVLR